MFQTQHKCWNNKQGTEMKCNMDNVFIDSISQDDKTYMRICLNYQAEHKHMRK